MNIKRHFWPGIFLSVLFVFIDIIIWQAMNDQYIQLCIFLKVFGLYPPHTAKGRQLHLQLCTSDM